MKLQIILLSCASLFSNSNGMLRPSPTSYQRVRPILKPVAIARKSPTTIQIEQLKAQRDATERELHKAREAAQYWKERAQHCQKNGCTQACLAQLQPKCNQIAEQQRREALQKFYKQQALDHRIPAHPLRPTAQR